MKPEKQIVLESNFINKMDRTKLQSEKPNYQLVKYERNITRKPNFARPSNSLTFWVQLDGTVFASHLWSSCVGRSDPKEKVYKI